MTPLGQVVFVESEEFCGLDWVWDQFFYRGQFESVSFCQILYNSSKCDIYHKNSPSRSTSDHKGIIPICKHIANILALNRQNILFSYTIIFHFLNTFLSISFLLLFHISTKVNIHNFLSTHISLSLVPTRKTNKGSIFSRIDKLIRQSFFIFFLILLILHLVFIFTLGKLLAYGICTLNDWNTSCYWRFLRISLEIQLLRICVWMGYGTIFIFSQIALYLFGLQPYNLPLCNNPQKIPNFLHKYRKKLSNFTRKLSKQKRRMHRRQIQMRVKIRSGLQSCLGLKGRKRPREKIAICRYCEEVRAKDCYVDYGHGLWDEWI